MIARAKQKLIEYLPPWYLCCEASRREVSSPQFMAKIFEVDLSKAREWPFFCRNCGQVVTATVGAPILGREYYVLPLEAFDIDEGAAA